MLRNGYIHRVHTLGIVLEEKDESSGDVILVRYDVVWIDGRKIFGTIDDLTHRSTSNVDTLQGDTVKLNVWPDRTGIVRVTH